MVLYFFKDLADFIELSDCSEFNLCRLTAARETRKYSHLLWKFGEESLVCCSQTAFVSSCDGIYSQKLLHTILLPDGRSLEDANFCATRVDRMSPNL